MRCDSLGPAVCLDQAKPGSGNEGLRSNTPISSASWRSSRTDLADVADGLLVDRIGHAVCQQSFDNRIRVAYTMSCSAAKFDNVRMDSAPSSAFMSIW